MDNLKTFSMYSGDGELVVVVPKAVAAIDLNNADRYDPPLYHMNVWLIGGAYCSGTYKTLDEMEIACSRLNAMVSKVQ